MTEERITSRRNPTLQLARRLLTSRRAREETGMFAADGVKLLAEAVRWCDWLDTVILADGVEAELPQDVRRIRVPKDVMASISPMEAPQGALLLCRMPDKPQFVPAPAMLLLDGIQDPGNLGTILRTADALDIPIALLEGCADLYNPKTVRASMGALFRMRVAQTTWRAAYEQCARARVPIGVAALSDRAEDIRRVPMHTLAVVIGSEGQGVRGEILKSADRALIIPMSARCESLNAAVAAAIVMWQMKQQ